MIYLIWSIINITIGLYFLYLLIGVIAKGKVFFNTKYKFLSITIFAIGLVQLLSGSNSEENNKTNFLLNDQIPHVKYEANMLKLEENLIFDINIFVKYYTDQNKIVMDKTNSFLTGFVSGFDWEHTSTELKLNQNNNPDYVVNGILNWKLLGFNVYSQNKTFSGTIKKR